LRQFFSYVFWKLGYNLSL